MIMRLGSGGATRTSICKRLWAPAVVVRTPMIATAMDARARPSLLYVPMALIFTWTLSRAIRFREVSDCCNQAIALKTLQ